MRVEGFNVREESRRTLVPMRKLSFERAKIEMVECAAPETFLGDGVELSPNLIVTEFLDISGVFPALINVSGFVRDVSRITFSQKEVEMKSFILQDSRGKYFQCCCHGRHSYNEAFEENAQIVFFASANVDKNSKLMLWVYDNAHVVRQRKECQMPPLTQAITGQV